MEYLREGIFTRLVESSIQIFAKKTGTVVTSCHPIRVQHWHNVKMIFLTQFLEPSLIWSNCFDETLTNIGGIWLAWMYSCSDQNYFLIISWLIEVGELENGYRQSTKRSPSCLIFEIFRDGLWDFSHKGEQLRVGIGHTVGKTDSVSRCVKIVCKRHSKIGYYADF